MTHAALPWQKSILTLLDVIWITRTDQLTHNQAAATVVSLLVLTYLLPPTQKQNNNKKPLYIAKQHLQYLICSLRKFSLELMN